MDITDLLKAVASAVEDTKAKEAYTLEASRHLTEVQAEAKAEYDAKVGAAQKAYDEANAEYTDAKVAGQRLRDQANEALGGLFSSDPRVRMG
jgi:hypothetical protein